MIHAYFGDDPKYCGNGNVDRQDDRFKDEMDTLIKIDLSLYSL